MDDTASSPMERSNIESETTVAFPEITLSAVPVYANHVGTSAMQHEIVLDFFQLLPAGNSGSGAHVSRIILPLSLLKGLTDALNEQITLYEQLGRDLPNLREAGE